MKALKDWTLEEIKELCSHRKSDSCDTCPLYVFCDNVGYISPDAWDLIAPAPPMIETTIKWHKYPEDMPTAGDTFDQVLIVTKNRVRNEYRNTLTPCVIKGITAWAELPDIPLWDGD